MAGTFRTTTECKAPQSPEQAGTTMTRLRFASLLGLILAVTIPLQAQQFGGSLAISGDHILVGEASNGQEALAVVAEQQPDVVLMDIEMPVMGGLTATQAIKRQWPAVRVITISVNPKYRASAIAAGADAFLLKGAASDVLLNAIIDVANLNDKES